MKVEDNAVNVSDHAVRINAELLNVDNSSSCLHLHKEGATLNLSENNFMKRSLTGKIELDTTELGFSV